MPFMYYGYGFVLIGFLIALLAQWNVQSTYSKYKKVQNARGLTGAMAARQILDQNGLYHVRIEPISGELTDHFDPRTNVVRLSDSVYNSSSVAAVGVAAHEVGHAIQYAQDYAPMRLRAAIIPATQIGSTLSYPLVLLGLFFGATPLMDLGILLFSLVVLFQLVTLPVEFNASRRALKTLESSYILDSDEVRQSGKVLTAAALTYVAALATALLNLMRLIAIRGRRD
ncbi:zinc metallopeptidase [Ruminococcus sp.]|uniref:zinc metallopeptidase n=1 Tax=Ruminococcus sp. TaxID=41978 RepID=UPI0025FC7F60|nr:zinc metallopeptidase [Ruminococcus sp.]MCI5815912.1 zinc metallopeptidase [Ruminococcus sp.]MDD7555970.1 zinc metallopeptidase [Ruminococcus sp.]MDY4963080.1 zinc metallopeptidase [Ruminococcus callidus]